MQILVLLGMYFDAAVVLVKNTSLLIRLALAALCSGTNIFVEFAHTIWS